MINTPGYTNNFVDDPSSASGSFSPLLNRQVLYVKEVDITCTRDELEALLQALCPPHLGTVKVPLNVHTGNIMGYAYLNFYNQEDAAVVLDEWRFKLYVRGRRVKMLYAMAFREALDIIFGPPGQSHVVFVNNISPEVDAAALFERFRLHGEVLTCEVALSKYNVPYGIIHYMEEASVPIAVQAEDNSHFHHTIIKVAAHNAHASYLVPAQPQTAPLALQSSTDFPTLGAAPTSTSARTSQAGSDLDPHNYSQHPVTAFAHISNDTGSSQYDEQPPLRASSNGTATSSGSPSKQNAHLGALQQPLAAAAAASASKSSSMHPVFDRLVKQRDRMVSPAGQPAGIPVPMPMPVATPLTTPAPAQVTPSAAATSIKSEVQAIKPVRTAAAAAGDHRQSAKELVKATLTQLDRLSDMLCCPITQEPFQDPVVAADGHSYERSAIEAWMAKSATSPLTNTKLAHKNLLPNTLIKHLCEEFS